MSFLKYSADVLAIFLRICLAILLSVLVVAVLFSGAVLIQGSIEERHVERKKEDVERLVAGIGLSNIEIPCRSVAKEDSLALSSAETYLFCQDGKEKIGFSCCGFGYATLSTKEMGWTVHYD